MAEVDSLSFELGAQCEEALSNQGRLALQIPGFVAREAQISLAKEIVQSIESKTILVAEAGTGTGKTYAYLIPALLSGKKTLISTATKTLQDQLFYKDLPQLTQALGLSTQIQNLKGRQNYICQYRTHLFSEEGNFASKSVVSDILLVRAKLSRLTEGVRGELPEVKEDAPVWPYVTSTTENCLNNECPHYQDCFLVKARKKAMEADLVVINHHLFFADSRLKEDGFGELLPGTEVVVFDEAHQLAEIATGFYGQRLSTRQLEYLLKDIIQEWPILDLANRPFSQLRLDLDKLVETLQRAISFQEVKKSWQVLIANPTFQEGMAQLEHWLNQVKQCFDALEKDLSKGLKRMQERLESVEHTFSIFKNPPNSMILWVASYKQSLVFTATPLDIAETFKGLLAKQPSTWLFTSATLTTGTSFDSFTHPLGLEKASSKRFLSPFRFKEQSLLYLPRGLPDPKHVSYYDRLVEKALVVINACEGRSFFLFTSHRALNLVGKLIAPHLKYPLLIQGEEAKPILLAKFREYGNAVLLGTATFWEGVDVKGDALSCVIIDKLPFSHHNDPVIRGKMAYLESKGLSSFDSLMLPEAILNLKQGVGRLIRDINDRGVLMIADPRVTAREYGKKIFESLPNMTKTRDEKKVLAFIKNVMPTL